MKNGWQWLPALGLGVFLLLLIGAPLADVFVKAVIIDDRLDFSYALATLAEPGNGQMIANSLLLGALVVVLSTCFAVPVAYLLSRTELAR